MPVLSTPRHTIVNPPGLTSTSTYIFLGGILIICIGIIISRKSPAQTLITMLKPVNKKEEKKKSHYIINQGPRIPLSSGDTKPLWPGITTFKRLYRV
jgi:hypothetical protein